MASDFIMPLRFEMVLNQNLNDNEVFAMPALTHLTFVNNRKGKKPFFVVEYPLQWMLEQDFVEDVNRVLLYMTDIGLKVSGVGYGYSTTGEEEKRFDSGGFQPWRMHFENNLAKIDIEDFQIGKEKIFYPYLDQERSDDSDFQDYDVYSEDEYEEEPKKEIRKEGGKKKKTSNRRN